MGDIEVPYMIGYVFWPALPAAGGASILATFGGAILARKVPGRILRIIFGVILIGVSISMVV